MIELLILALATYGASKLLSEYDGFGSVLYKIRSYKWLAMLSCTVCASVWIAAIFCIVWAFGYAIWLTPLALVGVTILIEEKL